MGLECQYGQAAAGIRWGNLRPLLRQGPTGQIANHLAEAAVATPSQNFRGIEDIVVDGERGAYLMLNINHPSRAFD